MSSHPVVLIGLDAFDSGLALEWAAAGELPHLARLLDAGGRCTVRNPFGLFVGAVWISFASALRPERHLFHCWDEIDPASYRWRLNPPKPELYVPFWTRIGLTGRRVAAIDVPHARADHAVNGLELFEWGCHDRHYGLHSAPLERAREVAARFGLHPVLGMDAWRERQFSPDDFFARRRRYRDPAEERMLADSTVEGAATKARLLEALLSEEDWDLFVGVFGEGHAIGHQQWHLHDPGHPRFDAAARDALGGDPILKVYREIDAGLGRVLAAAPANATILVHLSHGMTAHHDGTLLLDQVLARLETGPPAAAADRAAAGFREWMTPVLPLLQNWADGLRLPIGLRTRLSQAIRGDRPHHRAQRRFYWSPNNSVYGGVRLNLIGREPQGKVRPDEADAVMDDIERGLLDLVNVATGEPAVLAVHRTERHHRRSPGDTMPDLLIEWNRTAPIETVASPRIGTVHTRYGHWRTGDHRPDGLLVAVGEGIEAGSVHPPIAVEDIGPSVAARLGVALDDVDGRPVGWLADGHEAMPAVAAASRASLG